MMLNSRRERSSYSPDHYSREFDHSVDLESCCPVPGLSRENRGDELEEGLHLQYEEGELLDVHNEEL
jgi:hypothetical protein